MKYLKFDYITLLNGMVIFITGLMYTYWRGDVEQEFRDAGILISFSSAIYVCTLFVNRTKWVNLLSYLVYAFYSLFQLLPISLWLTQAHISDTSGLPYLSRLYAIPHFIILANSLLSFYLLYKRNNSVEISPNRKTTNIAWILILIAIGTSIYSYVSSTTVLIPSFRKKQFVEIQLDKSYIPSNSATSIQVKTEGGATDIQTFLWNLRFNDKTIILSRMDSGMIENTFWQKKIKNINTTDINSLYNNADWGEYLYFNETDNKYFSLEPGGHTVIFLTVYSYMDMLANTHSTQNNIEENLVTKKDCEYEALSWSTNWKSVTCKNVYIFEGKLVDQNIRSSCYIPVENSDMYVAFEQPVAPVSTDFYLCEELSNMGIQLIEVATN